MSIDTRRFFPVLALGGSRGQRPLLFTAKNRSPRRGEAEALAGGCRGPPAAGSGGGRGPTRPPHHPAPLVVLDAPRSVRRRRRGRLGGRGRGGCGLAGWRRWRRRRW